MMRTLLSACFVISLMWRLAISQYDSCNFDDYQNTLIHPTTLVPDDYFYLALPGVCMGPRGDLSLLLISVTAPDVEGDLTVNFPDDKGRPITNQFDAKTLCLAFIAGTVTGPTVLIRGDDQEPLLTIGPEIELSINGSSVTFNASYTDVSPQRLQICTNTTHATYYIDCKEVETKPFTRSPSAKISSLSILGEIDPTTSKLTSIFNGAVQQLYSVQCTDELADMTVLSTIQCRSVPTNADANGEGCMKSVETNLTQVLEHVVDDLPTAPHWVVSFCDIIAWRYSSKIAVQDITEFEIRLFNENSERISTTAGYEPFYILNKTEDLCFIQDDTKVQVRVKVSSSESSGVRVSPFSEEISLNCPPPKTPNVHFELRGVMYEDKSIVNITKVGEGEDALICRTNHPTCCKANGGQEAIGEFYYPNGVQVPIQKMNHGFYRNRGEQTVRLNRRMDVKVYSPTGAFCCEVVDACNKEQSICMYLVM